MSNEKIVINEKTKQVDLRDIGSEVMYDTLPPGVYKVRTTPVAFGTRYDMETMELKLPTSAFSIAKQLVDFDYLDVLLSADNKIICDAMNIRRKVGYLLHGIQGSGKTTTMHAMAHLLIEKYSACAFIVESAGELRYLLNFLEMTRSIQDYPCCIMFDECEDVLEDREDEMKLILDGYKSPDNCVFLFATNYIDQIPDTIKDRPSRFKYVKDIGTIEDAGIVYDIMKEMNNTLPDHVKVPDETIRNRAQDGSGKTLDFVKNMFMDICFENLAALKRLQTA